LPAAQESHLVAACSENFPASHGTQVEAAAASTAAEYVPGPQSVQTEAPSTEYLPAVQLVHSVTELAPAFFENFPPAHFTQVEAAVASATAEYVPGTQSVQTEAPPTEYVPAAQPVHMEAEVAAVVGKDFPAGHGTQVEAPAPAEYVQAVQSAQALTPPTEYVPRQQLLHQKDVVAPVWVENCPAGHLTHVLAPSDTEYVPALQTTRRCRRCS
jgi:hypothetical protein